MPRSSAHRYDPTTPSTGLTVDTDDEPIDMIAVLRRLDNEKGLRLNAAERAMVDRLKAERKAYPKLGTSRAEAYRRLARSLTDAV